MEELLKLFLHSMSENQGKIMLTEVQSSLVYDYIVAMIVEQKIKLGDVG